MSQFSSSNRYDKWVFSASTRYQDVITHDVYEIGHGAPVILIQELPGISKETFRLADKFVAQGFKVFLPHLFGPIGKVSILGNSVRILCMRKEIRLFQNGQSSPIVDWLKALCAKVKDENNAKGVGVVGMCLTGNFALALMADENVLAAVLSQPSLPLLNKTGLQLSEAELEAILNRRDEQPTMLGFRFKEDRFCPHAKFKTLDQTLNHVDSERIELTELPGGGHSVISLDFVDEAGHPTFEAVNSIFALFKKRLNESE